MKREGMSFWGEIGRLGIVCLGEDPMVLISFPRHPTD